MIGRKLILILVLFLCWNPVNTNAEITRSERTVHYQIDYQMNPVLKFIVKLLGFKFLNWEELILKEGWAKLSAASEQVTVFTAQPKDADNPILYLKNDGGVIEGFGKLLSKENKFTEENAVNLLSALNKLYSDSEENFEINAPNLFQEIQELQKDRGSMYCKIAKKKDYNAGKYLITVITFNGSKQANAEIEILYDPKEKVFESVTANLKIPVRIVLTRIP